jgi:hypothetical protein
MIELIWKAMATILEVPEGCLDWDFNHVLVRDLIYINCLYHYDRKPYRSST